MASSKEAFAKFEMWKKSRTVLTLTSVIKGGKPETLTGEIIVVDEIGAQVSFLARGTRRYRVIDFSGVSFGVERRVVSAEFLDGNFLTCEEVGVI